MAPVREVKSYKIETAMIPQSLNRVMRWNRFRKTRERDTWAYAIFVLLGRKAAKDLRERAERKERMRICVTICNPRRYDDDNAHGACKIIFDACRQQGLIHDDRAEFLQQEVRQEKATAKTKHTVIEIGAA
jgi:hypothetical protein